MSRQQAVSGGRQQARFNMIEQQIRTWEVLDPVVLNLLNQVPREDFVPARYAGLAFADLEIPIGSGQVMLPPKLEARMLQALQLNKKDTVLEIGSGSGYMTALLAKLAKEVHSIEIESSLSTTAAQRLVAHGISNIILEVGDASRGWGTNKYDAIILTGSVPLLPATFEQQLNKGGRLLAVVGDAPVMEALLVTCIAPGVYHREVLFETCIPPLENAAQPERFRF